MRIARTDESPALPDGAGTALFDLVRFWSRRWMHGASPTADENALAVLVLEATKAAAQRGPVAIGDVATELGLDRSGASRMVATTVASGHLRKAAGLDARRAELTITAKGRRLLAAAHAWQDDVFADLVAEWPARDAERFAGYLIRLATQETDRREMSE